MELGSKKGHRNEFSSSDDEDTTSGKPTTIGRCPGDSEEAVMEFVALFNYAWDKTQRELAQEKQKEIADHAPSSPPATRSSTGHLPPPIRRLHKQRFPGPSSGANPKANEKGGKSDTKKPSRSLKKTTPTVTALNVEESNTQDVVDPSAHHQSPSPNSSCSNSKARESSSGEKTLVLMSVSSGEESVIPTVKEYCLEKIEGARIGHRWDAPVCLESGIEYKVLWKAGLEEDNSWEVESNIDGEEELISQLWREVIEQNQINNQMTSSQVLEVTPIKDSNFRKQAVANLLII